MVDKKVFLSPIYHIETQGKDNKRAVKTDEEMEGVVLLWGPVPGGARHRHTAESSS